MKNKKYDFSGWATRNDIQCSDGRVIRKNAFIEQNGTEVPIVYNHSHDDMGDIVGHGLLENREEGVYMYGFLNDTEKGILAKKLLKHGDIRNLSIYANKLKSKGSEILHGTIREVSLVLAGANPGAYIDTVIAHSAYHDEEANIFTGFVDNDEGGEFVEHAEKEDEKPVAEPEKKAEDNQSGKTVRDIYNTLNEDQKKAVAFIVGAAIEDAKKSDTNKADDKAEEKAETNTENTKGEKEMKHNAFDTEEKINDGALMHDAMNAIISDAKRFGSMKESYIQHAEEYGIKDIEWLFPDYQKLEKEPGFLKRNPDAWVGTVMSGVHHTPFSRIKMMFADIREDEARAKGYIKGNLKKEEVFSLLKRTVDPQTIYKKQKLDRDDVIDITDFDVVSWLKGEMRMMLDEEIARAILFGDGRTTLSDDKIQETHIIPIANDAALYTIQATVTPAQGETLGHALINAAVKSQDTYEGSGNTTLFIPNTYVTDMLLLEDVNGRRIYKNVSELALAMSVNKIVKVPNAIVPSGVYGVIVDLKDYNVGADKGGAINMFDDFDIDYNQMKYLIETRCSGALTKPYSAIVLKAE